MLFDEIKGAFQLVDQHGADDKRDAQAGGVGQQHEDAPQNFSLPGCHGQGRAEECAHAGRPAHGKHHAEEGGGEEMHLLRPGGFHAAEDVPAEYAEKVETEQDHDGPGDQIQQPAVLLKKSAQSAGQGAHEDEHQGESAHKSQGVGEGFAGGALSAAGEVGHIDRQHGEQAGGDEGNNPFQKGNEVLHTATPFVFD